jgi:hypothetical protein
MGPRNGKPFLVSSFRRKSFQGAPDSGMKNKRRFQTGDLVPETGIYRVAHQAHRLPHEVIILADQRFPRCCKCGSAVLFELVHAAPDLFRYGVRHLYELPLLEQDVSARVA